MEYGYALMKGRRPAMEDTHHAALVRYVLATYYLFCVVSTIHWLQYLVFAPNTRLYVR